MGKILGFVLGLRLTEASEYFDLILSNLLFRIRSGRFKSLRYKTCECPLKHNPRPDFYLNIDTDIDIDIDISPTLTPTLSTPVPNPNRLPKGSSNPTLATMSVSSASVTLTHPLKDRRPALRAVLLVQIPTELPVHNQIQPRRVVRVVRIVRVRIASTESIGKTRLSYPKNPGLALASF